jgi:hypothetical protein
MPAWRHLASNDGAPAGPAGSLMVYGTSGGVQVILPGIQDQALAMAGGVPTWVSTLLPPGTTLPISQPGDLVVGAVTTGQVARLARGPTDSVLTTGETGGLVWRESGTVSRGRGQCRLAYHGSNARGASLVLRYHQGSQIWINGASRTIPEAGVLLTATGLSANTTYYVYATWIGGVMGLEASTTGYTIIAGLAHKSGDESRTLVGFARVGPTSVFGEEGPHQKFLLSYFNPVAQVSTAYFTAQRSHSYEFASEVHPEIRSEFIAWQGQSVVTSMSGMVLTDTDGFIGLTTLLAVDGLYVQGSTAGHQSTSLTKNVWHNIATTMTFTVNEGYHYVTLLGRRDPPGAASYHGDPGGIIATRTHVLIGWI